MAAFTKLVNSIYNALNGYLDSEIKSIMCITYWDMSKNDVIGGHFKFEMTAFTKAANMVINDLTRFPDPTHVVYTLTPLS
jgi:hypothetical protein